jgi:small subunit ribosomal protein S16
VRLSSLKKFKILKVPSRNSKKEYNRTGESMATVVRLTRMGRKKKPFYRIVVTDSRKRRDGGWIESIGYYNPLTEPETIKFDKERLDYWKSVGAKLSDRVARITK